MEATQTSRRQQTAPPQPCCSKDVTAHPHRPGARPGRPFQFCVLPLYCSGKPLSGQIGFRTEFFCCWGVCRVGLGLRGGRQRGRGHGPTLAVWRGAAVLRLHWPDAGPPRQSPFSKVREDYPSPLGTSARTKSNFVGEPESGGPGEVSH